MPWSTGFEDGFCEYPKLDGPGYCYGDAPYVLVSEPHRPGGKFAAEFKVIDDPQNQNQTRCVRQGELPQAAYYGAWYYIPQAPNDKSVWNLWHFQGGDDPDSQHDLWDVSLANGAQAGDWELTVLDRPSGFDNYRSADHIRIPIGSWFHIELFLKRASDATGVVALYQDGVQLFNEVNLTSDASKFTQWYVGDWAHGPTPETSILYVDDVSISATLGSISATP
ncbi:MAG: heparin lyase I family protein [Polyangiaceae bacterium]